MRSPKNRSRLESSHAFTLVELLVVITIIGILISLLLPAVQSAREAARQAQCQNNLKQLGLAALNYESTLGCFPPAINIEGTETGASPTVNRVNWVICLLPYLEQQPLYQSFDLTKPISDSANSTARGATVPAMLCPSDEPSSQRTKCSQNGGNWARGNYGANTGLRLWATDSWEHQYRRGVMGVGQALPVEGIKDGTSNTTMFLELRAGLIAADPRGTWAMGMIAASSVSCHACNGTYSPNPCETSCGDDDLAGTYATPINAMGSRVLSECMKVCGVGTNFQGASRSRHPGGVNTAFADGSVHFISNYVESGTIGGSPSGPTNFLTWQRLNVATDGLSIDGKKY